MIRILFNISNITQLNEHLKVAKYLLTKNKFEFIFLLNSYSGSFSSADIQSRTVEVNAALYLEKDLKFDERSVFITSVLKRLPERLKNFIYRRFRINCLELAKLIENSLGKINTFSDFLKKHDPDLVVVAEDGIGSNFHVIKAADRIGIKSLIIPYEYSGEKQMFAGARQCHRYDSASFGKRYRQFLKKYFFYDDKQFFSFISINELIAYKYTRALPENTKTVHGGNAHCLAAESTAMLEHYISEEIPESKIKLTGSMNDDIILEKVRDKSDHKARITRHFGLNSDLPLIVFSFIPEYAQPAMFTDYREYVSTIHTLLSKHSRLNVIYQFHPSVREENRKIASDIGCNISNEPTIDLLCAADVYMTSYSSTIRWASAIGIPAVDLDIYGFNYDDYEQNPGVIKIRTKTDLFDLFENRMGDPLFFKNVENKLKIEKNRWGMLDGKSGDRLHDLITGLC